MCSGFIKVSHNEKFIRSVNRELTLKYEIADGQLLWCSAQQSQRSVSVLESDGKNNIILEHFEQLYIVQCVTKFHNKFDDILALDDVPQVY